MCANLERLRRLAVADTRLAEALAGLPHDRWRVEAGPRVDGHRIPFLVLGETGVFALWGDDTVPHYDEIVVVHRVAGAVQALLPGYAGKVQPALCRVFAEPEEPRMFCRADESAAWAWLLMGSSSVVPWLTQFAQLGPNHGLNPTDLARFDELAGPRWKPASRPQPNIPYCG